MRIGVIFCAWQSQDTVEKSLGGWQLAREYTEHDIHIVAVAVPFEGFPEEPQDGTVSLLQRHLIAGEIDYLITNQTPVKETEARGAALKRLIDKGVDVTIMVDSDEFYSLQDIERIFAFVAARPQVTWFRLCLKNYVFDDKTYLIQPFCPPRIHRIDSGKNSRADHFWDDNSVMYRGIVTGQLYHDIELPVATVPKNVAWIKHHSWLNNERSRNKVAYQSSRPGWQCSFDWDDSRGGLIWRDGHPIPETAKDA